METEVEGKERSTFLSNWQQAFEMLEILAEPEAKKMKKDITIPEVKK